MKTWLLLDTNYLAWKAFYTTGKLSHDGEATGVAYGVFRDILHLQDQFTTNDVVFCFDYGKGLRHKIYPEYKANREEDDKRKAVRKQVKLLREEYLPTLGFNNILYEKGYEADDMIAQVCSVERFRQNQFIIISGDKDLYQCLRPNVSIWDAKKKRLLTDKVFQTMYGIAPVQWSSVKAIAGCSSDNIKGVHGVGEFKAIKFLKGQCSELIKQKMLDAEDVWKRNLPLVRLPYEGLPIPVLSADNVTDKKWRTLLDRLGMKSLLKPQRISGGFGLTRKT